MRTLVAGILKRSALAAHNLASQVVVSVAAAICVAVISNSYFEAPTRVASVERPITTDAVMRIAPQKAVQAKPLEGAAQEVKAPARIPVARPATPKRQASAEPASPKPQDRQAAEAPQSVAAALPAMLPVSHGTEIFVENTEGAAPARFGAPADPATRPRILGLPLPRFVPTYDGVAQSVGFARDKVAAVVEDIRD